MTFTFPNPQTTPEFTGDNGITYAWDTVDRKWQVKSFTAEEEDIDCIVDAESRFIHDCVYKRLSDGADEDMFRGDMDGPGNPSLIKQFVFGKNVDTSSIKIGSTFSLTYNGEKNTYKALSNLINNADRSVVEVEPLEIKTAQFQTGVRADLALELNKRVSADCLRCEESDQSICQEISQLHQDVISLDEEIESIAKSMEKGFWRYEQASDTHRSPREGHFYLLKNYTPDTGGVGAEFTEEYSEAEAVVFNNKEWNPDTVDGNGGGNHTWADVEVGELIDLLDKPDPDFLFGKITHVDKGHHNEGVIIAFDKIEFEGSPTNHSSGINETLLKIFKEPTGGTASEFVKKTGDKMSGTLTMGDTTQMSDSSNTHSPEIVFKAKTSSGTIRTNALQVKADANTLYATGSFRSGGSLSTASTIQYQGGDRINLGIASDYQDLRVGNNIALKWNSDKGVYGIRANNSWGSSGQILKKGSSYPYWTSETQSDWNETSSTSPAYIQNKPTIPDVKYTITKDSNGNYYVQ